VGGENSSNTMYTCMEMENMILVETIPGIRGGRDERGQ
jgi:hypothetical protein